MFTRRVLIAVVTAVIGFCAPAAAQDPAQVSGRLNPVLGEKLDSGLGELSPNLERRVQWNAGPAPVAGRLNPVLGEKLDSGLGELSVTREASVAIVPVPVRTARN